MTVTLFLELWYLLPYFAPLLDSARALEWTTKLVEMGLGKRGRTIRATTRPSRALYNSTDIDGPGGQQAGQSRR